MLSLGPDGLDQSVQDGDDAFEPAGAATARKFVEVARQSLAAILGLSSSDSVDVVNTLVDAGLPSVLFSAVQSNDNILRSLALMALLALFAWVRGCCCCCCCCCCCSVAANCYDDDDDHDDACIQF